jgi:hypothetical protein
MMWEMRLRTSLSPILIRWGMALVAVSIGWVFGIASYVMGLALYLLLVPRGSFVGLGIYALVTGFFCLVAWLIVGFPLSIWNPTFSSRTNVFAATMLSGAIGLCMVFVAFRPSRLTFNVIPLMAFLTGAVSMMAYVKLLKSLKYRIPHYGNLD